MKEIAYQANKILGDFFQQCERSAANLIKFIVDLAMQIISLCLHNVVA